MEEATFVWMPVRRLARVNKDLMAVGVQLADNGLAANADCHQKHDSDQEEPGVIDPLYEGSHDSGAYKAAPAP